MRSTPQVLELRTHAPQVSYEFLVRRSLGMWKIGDRLNHVADVGWAMLMTDGVHNIYIGSKSELAANEVIVKP